MKSIPDCNVKANVERDFLFHEVILKPEAEPESRVSSGTQVLFVVVTKRIPWGVDYRRTFILPGKRVHLVNQ